MGDYNKKWKATICHIGESCWCRGISDIDDNVIIDIGAVYKEFIEYTVALHNNKIEKEETE